MAAATASMAVEMEPLPAMSHDEYRAALADCPLVEIVHFHDCLRGEVQHFAAGARKLRAMVGGVGSFSKEAIDLEAQLHSQFHSLRRVFQAHSKAEDDLIWPALREKAWRDGVAGDKLEDALEEDHSDEEYIFTEIEMKLSSIEEACPREGAAATSESAALLAQLEALADRASDNMIRHLQREETEVLPLIQRCFSREEMARLVGTILGERPGDLMDTILAMMFRNLTPEAREDMLRHVKYAVDGTFFDRWLSYVRSTHQGQAGQEGWASIAALVTTQAEGKVPEGGGADAARRFMACECCDDDDDHHHHHDANHDEAGAAASAAACDPRRKADCRMCRWVGRCPRESKLEPGEFERAVSAIAREASLSQLDKTRAVQMLRGCSWRHQQEKLAKAAAVAAAAAGGAGAVGAAGSPHKRPRGGGQQEGEGGEGEDGGAGAAQHQRLHSPPGPGAAAAAAAAEAEAPAAAPGKEPRQRVAAAGPPQAAPVSGEAALKALQAAMTAEERAPSYVPGGGAGAGAAGVEGERVLGCEHYQRACKLRAPCCGRWFTCRLCHDARATDHEVDRYAVTEIACMRCGEVQPPAQHCRSPACRGLGKPLAAYYCAICHLYEDDPSRDIYHCPFCNVCRQGKGLGEDMKHCMRCNACIRKVKFDGHTCIEGALQGDCPVCKGKLFDSTKPLKNLPLCGHSMHRDCYEQYRTSAYTCPLCKKSMEDMTAHFASLDLWVQASPMPPEFAAWRARILCNDCGEESGEVPYHFLYHKCPACGSYNTRVLQAGDWGQGQGQQGEGGGGGGGDGNAAASSSS